jgi:pteridine reductase
MIAGVQQAFGRIDVLVNCAAIWRPKPLESTTAADLREHWEANTLGTFLCAQHAGLAMCAQPAGGVIVNVGDWATRRPYRNYAAYFASKGAIPTITRMLAVELSSRNPQVRVSAILPGPVMLPDDLPAAERQQAIDATLLRRAGAPANVVQGVLYLIDNDFVTGDCLTIDGGRSISG